MRMNYTLLPLLLILLAFGPMTARSAAADDRVEEPDTFTLSAAYPNPFNPQTSFSLTVDDRQEVAVEVFNLLGVRIEQLFRGEMQSGEMREFTFVADDIPSGIYLYRVQGENFTATRQMTLLK